MTVRLSNSVRNARVDAVANAIDGGAGAGIIRIYTGGQPASVATAPTGALLVTLTCNDPSFDAAVAGVRTMDVTPNVTGDAVAGGVTGWARFLDSGLAPPVLNAPSTATTGGTLAAATYFYVITALNANGETLKSNEVSIATTGTTSTVTLGWTAVAGATGYRVYRSTTTGTEQKLNITDLGAVTTYTDTGAATVATNPPTLNSTPAAVMDVTVGESASDLTISESTLVTGQAVTVDAANPLTLTDPA